MNCIICQDIGLEPLKENKSCKCKYKYHSSCWIDYVHSNVKIKCPMCRTELTKKGTKTSLKKSTLKHENMPYRPEPSAPLGTSDNIETHYQEFQETVTRSINNTQQNRVTSSSEQTLLESQNNNSLKLSKFVKLLLCSVIITAIVIVIILI